MMDFVTSSTPKVGCSKELAPRSNALFNIKVLFQRIGGTTSYATASSHQMKTCPFSIILRKKSWSSPTRNSGRNGCSQSGKTPFFKNVFPVRTFLQSITKQVGSGGRL